MDGAAIDLARLVPTDDDLPGTGWMAITGELTSTEAAGAAELFDCVGPAFPEQELLATHDSPRYLRPPGQLVYGLAARFAGGSAAARAADILAGAPFARCLARSVVADLTADRSTTEILDVEVEPLLVDGRPIGNRATFTGGGADGLALVHLDVTVVRAPEATSLVWFGGFVEPIDPADRDEVLSAIRQRAGRHAE